MFSEYIKVEKCRARFLWLQPDGTTREEHFCLAEVNELEHSAGYQMNAPVLCASFSTGAIPESLLQGRPVSTYKFRDMLEVYRHIIEIFSEGDDEVVPGIYVKGGWYPNGQSREFGLVNPGNGIPYMFVGEPWHPLECIYRLQEDGHMVKTGESILDYFFGPEEVVLSDDLIHKMQVALQNNPFYEG